MSMSKKEIINQIVEKSTDELEKRVTKKDATAIYEAALEVIAESIFNGERVFLEGIGTFETIVRDPKVCRDFNGNKLEIPARYAIKFRLSPKMKSAVAEKEVE